VAVFTRGHGLLIRLKVEEHMALEASACGFPWPASLLGELFYLCAAMIVCAISVNVRLF